MKRSLSKPSAKQQQDELISEIIQEVKETCSAKIVQDKMLRQRLKDLLNRKIEKESATETKEVTVLLSDLRGFTAMSEQIPATSVIVMLNRYFSKMSKIIVTDYNGTIDKIMGDAIMALFGAPDERGDDLKRALSCAVEMQIAMDEINDENKSLGLPELFMGIGINTGIVVAGKLGSELHSQYTVIGDEVNLAARVEAYSLRGQILISSNVYEKAKNLIETVEPAEVYMKGKQSPIKIYELLSVKEPKLLSVPRREIRKSPRVEVYIEFAYHCIEGKTILPEKHKGTIIDISHHGIFASTPQPLEPFSDIKFTLTLSILGGETSDIYAKVLKVLEKDDKHYASMEFTSISPEAKKAVKSFMERIIQGG